MTSSSSFFFFPYIIEIIEIIYRNYQNKHQTRPEREAGGLGFFYVCDQSS